MKVKTFEVKKGEDGRERSRFHVNLIMGARMALIVDTKYKPLLRTNELPLDIVRHVSTEEQRLDDVLENSAEVRFADRCEMASCITFPAGTTVKQVPLRGGTS